MITRITYTPDVVALAERAGVLHDAGQFLEYLTRDEETGKIAVLCRKTATVYANGTLHSVSNCVFPDYDVYGKPDDPDYVPFFEAVGMECLASGTNNGGVDCPYYKIEHGDAETLVKYETVYPPKPVPDSDETTFDRGCNWDE